MPLFRAFVMSILLESEYDSIVEYAHPVLICIPGKIKRIHACIWQEIGLMISPLPSTMAGES